jgi:hypothetical protein
MNREIYLALRKQRKGQMTIQEWWDFIADKPKAELDAVVNQYSIATERLRDYKRSERFRFKIRKFINEHGYTDVNPFEVVRIVSDTCVEIRAMKAELEQAPACLGVGGFSAVYENQGQKWKITSDLDSPVAKIRLGKKGWGRGRFYMSDEPEKFYDYNF